MKASLPLDYFKAMPIHLLNDYLSSRGISQTGNKETLAKNAFYAYSLNLPVNKGGGGCQNPLQFVRQGHDVSSFAQDTHIFHVVMPISFYIAP